MESKHWLVVLSDDWLQRALIVLSWVMLRWNSPPKLTLLQKPCRAQRPLVVSPCSCRRPAARWSCHRASEPCHKWRK